MNILLSTDNKYVMPTGVLMTSIGENCGDNVSYYILVDECFSEDSRQSLSRIAQRYNNDISFYAITNETTKEFPFGREDQPKGVTIATYFRLFITNILPESVDKIIYLDGDIIVRKNLLPLWNTDLTDCPIGAVHDMHEQYHCSQMRLPYNMEQYGYLNAGVLLINVGYWRKNHCIEQFFACVREHSNALQMHDQDVLNTVFYGKVKWLPVSYNFQSCFLEKSNRLGRFGNLEDEIAMTKRDPAIVHFTAEDKPWKIEVFHTYTKDWRKYYFKTQWKHCPLEGEVNNTLKQKLRNYLVRHCWYTPASIYEMF